VPEWFTSLGVKVSHDLKSALADAEVVMLLRIQHERQASSHFPSLGEYTSMFGAQQHRASWLNPKAIIMHRARSTAASRSTASSPTANAA